MRTVAIAAGWLVSACGSPAPQTPDADLGPWHAGADLPHRRLESGVANRAGHLVVVGGFGDGLAIESTVDDFDPATGVWTAGPQLPVAWSHLQVAAIGSRLFVLGGLAGTGFAAHGESFVDDGTGWRAIASLPAGHERGSSAVVVSGTTIDLLGGASTTAALATAWSYDSALDRWTALPDLPSPRSHPAGAVGADGTLFVVGGLATLDSSQPRAEVWALPPGAATWQPRAVMPTPRGGCAYGVVGGELLCAGGEAGRSALATLEAYDLTADTWRTLASMPEPRAGTQAAVIDGELRVPGGATHLAFDPLASVRFFRE